MCGRVAKSSGMAPPSRAFRDCLCAQDEAQAPGMARGLLRAGSNSPAHSFKAGCSFLCTALLPQPDLALNWAKRAGQRVLTLEV